MPSHGDDHGVVQEGVRRLVYNPQHFLGGNGDGQEFGALKVEVVPRRSGVSRYTGDGTRPAGESSPKVPITELA